MPSQLHEALLLLFRNRPMLAAELLREALGVELPGEDEAAFGIVVEVQLAKDADKRFVWPVYVANLRARLRWPVYLLVVTVDETVARWASQPVDLGGRKFLSATGARSCGRA